MAVALADGEPDGSARSIRDEALWLAQMQDRVDNLVREYRVRGHLMAKLDPLKLPRAATRGAGSRVLRSERGGPEATIFLPQSAIRKRSYVG